MDVRKAIKIESDMLTGNVNRMCVTHDPKELRSMYDYAKQRLESLFKYNVDRLDDENKLKEVFNV